MPTITLTVLSGPAAGSSCTKDHNKPIRIGRVKNGNALMVKDGGCRLATALLLLLCSTADLLFMLLQHLCQASTWSSHGQMATGLLWIWAAAMAPGSTSPRYQ